MAEGRSVSGGSEGGAALFGGRGTALAVLGIVIALVAVGVQASRGSDDPVDAASPGGTPRRAPRPDVLLIAVDGLGPLDVAALGGGLASTPSLDALAAGGVAYADAYAPSPWASEALAASLTARYRPAANPSDATPSLAQELGHLQYRTALVPAHERHAVDGLGFDASPRPEGFDDVAGATADAVATRALEWLLQGERPSLLAVTFADPRPPHHLYSGMVAEADAPYDGPVLAGLDHDDLLRTAPDFDAADRARLEALHASEVAAVDRAIGRLLTAARARRVTPPVVVVYGLRAPALGRGDRYGLVPSLDPEDLRVPLFVLFPAPLGESIGASPRGRIRTPVSLVDVSPTVLDAIGVDPRLDVDGRTVFPGARAPDRSLRASTSRGIRAAVLLVGDRALVLQADPPRAALRVREPDPEDAGGRPPGWVPSDAVTARDGDLRSELGAWMAGAGIVSAEEAQALGTASFDAE